MTRQFDHITLCSPSGALIDEALLERAISSLNGYNLPIVQQMNTRARLERFAGSDSDRVLAINMAAGISQSSLILATRGGYGLTRLLPQLNLQTIANNLNLYQHLLCGHSDITCLQLALMKAGAQPSTLLHGPMACFDFGQPEGVHPQTEQAFETAVFQGNVNIEWNSCNQDEDSVQEGTFEGPVWGGNLTLISSLIGTPWMPDIQNGIFIIEDVNEPAYKIERMLLQLAQAGVLERQKVIVFGDFGQEKTTNHDCGYDLNSVAKYLRESLSLRTLQGFPFGHVTPKACWFQGGYGTIAVSKQDDHASCRLTQSLTVN